MTAQRQRTRLHLLAVLALYAGALLAAEASGYEMHVSWELFHLLDEPALRARPLASLLLLHSQPPLLNVATAVVLEVADALGTSPELVSKVAFAAIGGLLALAIFALVEGVTHSIGLAYVAVVASVVDPGFHHFLNFYLYTFPIALIIVWLLLASLRFMESGSRGALAAVVLASSSLPLTRTLFPAFWPLLFLGLLLAARWWSAGRESDRVDGLRDGARGLDLRAALAAAAAIAVLVTLWPLKNQLVFGEYTYSSWAGYNLSANTGVRGDELWDYFHHGVVPPGLEEKLAALEVRFGEEAVSVVRMNRKSNGFTNWNHLAFLMTSDAIRDEALAWRIDNPGTWLARSLGQYPMWTRPTFVHPYSGTIVEPEGARPWARFYKALFFADVRPAIEAVWPDPAIHTVSLANGLKVPFTVFGVLLLPALLVGVTIRLARRLRARDGLPEAFTVVLALFCILWSLLVPCLTDGVEGNRMRFVTSAPLTLVALYALAPFYARARLAMAALRKASSAGPR